MNSQVRARHAYAVPPRRVMRAIADPDELSAWFGPSGVRVIVESVALDPRVGGAWQLALEGDEVRFTVDGMITAYRVDRLLEVRHQVAGVTGLKHDLLLDLRLELTETTEGTGLVVAHGPLPPTVLEDAGAMWAGSLGRLERLLTPPR